MATFSGTLVTVDDPGQPVEARIEIRDSRMDVVAGSASIGNWPLSEVAVSEAADGYHLLVEGEELVFRTQQSGFMAAVEGRSEASSPIASRLRSAAITEEPQALGTRPTVDPPVPSTGSSANGMAVTALVLSIVGSALGLVPLFGLFALIAGVLAVVFGVVGRRRVARGETTGGKTMASWGLGLGVVAIILGIVGMVIVGNALRDLEQDLDEITRDLEGFGTVDDVTIELEGCFTDGASGSVFNGHSAAVDVSIEVYFYSADGTQVDTSFDFVSGVRPGGRATWDAVIFGTEYSTCQAAIGSAFES